MKKITSLLITFTFIFSFFYAGIVYAASIDNLTIEVNKQIVRPSEEVTLKINFGESLGAYTFDVSYDDNIFEFVSVDGGTANDTSDKVIVTFYDTTGGSNPRKNMSIVFRAKSDITTSNPTELTVTGEGFANADASITYDDITTPIVKNITVEPDYQDYAINLTYSGEIIVNEEKNITISYSSSMGRYYEHARLVAEATTPDNGNVKLIGIDDTGAEEDIIQSGWGDAQGYAIGGKDVSQVLNVRGLFTVSGDYGVTLKLIDRDNSDTVIAQKQFSFTALNEATPVVPEEIPSEKIEETTPKEETQEQQKPTTLPKTGSNIFAYMLVLGIAIMVVCVIIFKLMALDLN